MFGNSDGANDCFFARFPNTTIPQGATISSVKLTFQAAFTSTGTVCNANVYFNDVDNATAPTTYTEANDKAVTAAISWNSVVGWTANSDYDSPSIVSILQAIVNRPGWASGQAMMVLVKNNSSSLDARRHPKTYEASTTLCARLVVTYTT